MGDKLPEGVQKMFKAKNFGHLATLMKDGSPHVAPVWVDCDEHHILVNTVEGHIKVNNVQRDPRVAISITNQENPYQRIMIRGRVVEIAHEGAEEHIDVVSNKYQGRDYDRTKPEYVRVILKIEPSRISGVRV